MSNLLREFDLEYWQMRAALGHPIPVRIEARWPHGMNMGNPYKCGVCAARRRFPGLHVSQDIRLFRERLTGVERDDFEHRVGKALVETDAFGGAS